MTEDEMIGWNHSMDMSLGELQKLVMERPGVLHSIELQKVGHD